MDDLKVKISGSSAGFEQSLNQAKADARKFAQSLPETWSKQAGNPFQFLSGKSQELIKRESEGIGGIAQRIAGGFGEAGESIMSLAKGPVGALSAGLFAVYEGAKKSWEAMKESFVLQRDARNLGMTTTGLQKFQQAGEEQGLGEDEVKSKLLKFENKVGSAASGDKSAADFFKDAGIEINGKNMEQILLSVAEAFQKIEDPAKRANMLTDMFGKNSAEMANVLEQIGGGQTVFERMGISDEQTDAVLAGSYKKIFGFLNGMKDAAKNIFKTSLANTITGVTGFEGEIETPNKVKVEKSAADKEKDAKAAEDQQRRIAAAQKNLRSEQYAGADDQNKLLMLLQEERELREQIAEAKKKGDRASELELTAELNRKQREEKGVRGNMKKDAAKKDSLGFAHDDSKQDSLSKMGLFTQSGLLFNPALEVSKQQLKALTDIKTGINKIADKPDIWS